MNLPKPNKLLVVEDSDDDYFVVARACKRAGLNATLHRASTGEEALRWLLQTAQDPPDPQAAPRPALVLLDLNLPGISGLDVLAEIKGHERLRSTPVVVLSTSGDVRDVARCYERGANSYIRKSSQFGVFVDAIAALNRYWFSTCIIP